mmetsp:Transcript_13161/g.32271  ORF Transcript_13161/g.32271 Transcript_13161/m.32271 type:complete len:216 (+) Transcript_13161:1147-1794(+)
MLALVCVPWPSKVVAVLPKPAFGRSNPELKQLPRLAVDRVGRSPRDQQDVGDNDGAVGEGPDVVEVPPENVHHLDHRLRLVAEVPFLEVLRHPDVVELGDLPELGAVVHQVVDPLVLPSFCHTDGAYRPLHLQRAAAVAEGEEPGLDEEYPFLFSARHVHLALHQHLRKVELWLYLVDLCPFSDVLPPEGEVAKDLLHTRFIHRVCDGGNEAVVL